MGTALALMAQQSEAVTVFTEATRIFREDRDQSPAVAQTRIYNLVAGRFTTPILAAVTLAEQLAA